MEDILCGIEELEEAYDIAEMNLNDGIVDGIIDIAKQGIDFSDIFFDCIEFKMPDGNTLYYNPDDLKIIDGEIYILANNNIMSFDDLSMDSKRSIIHNINIYLKENEESEETGN